MFRVLKENSLFFGQGLERKELYTHTYTHTITDSS